MCLSKRNQKRLSNTRKFRMWILKDLRTKKHDAKKCASDKKKTKKRERAHWIVDIRSNCVATSFFRYLKFYVFRLVVFFSFTLFVLSFLSLFSPFFHLFGEREFKCLVLTVQTKYKININSINLRHFSTIFPIPVGIFFLFSSAFFHSFSIQIHSIFRLQSPLAWRMHENESKKQENEGNKNEKAIRTEIVYMRATNRRCRIKTQRLRKKIFRNHR